VDGIDRERNNFNHHDGSVMSKFIKKYNDGVTEVTGDFVKASFSMDDGYPYVVLEDKDGKKWEHIFLVNNKPAN
jgi:hypothetical protein